MDEAVLTDMSIKVTELHTCILGNTADAKSEGLKGQVQRHERSLGGLHKLGWIIVAAFVAAVIGAIVVF